MGDTGIDSGINENEGSSVHFAFLVDTGVQGMKPKRGRGSKLRGLERDHGGKF